MKRTAALVFVFSVLCSLSAGAAAPAVGQPPGTESCTGPVERPAEAETVVLAQGLRVVGDRYEKRPAILAGYDREARPAWGHDLGDRGRFLARSVDATAAGTLVVSRERDHSVVELLDEERRPRWALRFGLGDGPRGDVDARDALLEDEGLLVADAERLVRYDLAADRVVREWSLPADAFPDPESNVTGVAPAPEGGYLVTVAGNGTGSLLSVGEAGVRWRVDDLREPYSPQSLGETVLVAEMGADRVVELDRDGETPWVLRGLDRPRSAERLPGGTTLVADRRSHRVLEVDAGGRVVWTAFVPWEPVDATRPVEGDPVAAADRGVAGTYAVAGANATYDELAACEAGLLELGTNRTERARGVADAGDARGLALAALVLVGGAVVVARRRL